MTTRPRGGGADSDRRAARLLQGAQHLFMPRFSVAYTLNERTGSSAAASALFYDKPEGNVIFSPVNLPPFVPSVSRRERQPRESARRPAAAAARCSAQSTRIDPDMKIPRQLQFQRQRAARAAGAATSSRSPTSAIAAAT